MSGIFSLQPAPLAAHVHAHLLRDSALAPPSSSPAETGAHLLFLLRRRKAGAHLLFLLRDLARVTEIWSVPPLFLHRRGYGRPRSGPSLTRFSLAGVEAAPPIGGRFSSSCSACRWWWAARMPMMVSSRAAWMPAATVARASQMAVVASGRRRWLGRRPRGWHRWQGTERQREIFFYSLWVVHSAMGDFCYGLLYCFFYSVSAKSIRNNLVPMDCF